MAVRSQAGDVVRPFASYVDRRAAPYGKPRNPLRRMGSSRRTYRTGRSL